MWAGIWETSVTGWYSHSLWLQSVPGSTHRNHVDGPRSGSSLQPHVTLQILYWGSTASLQWFHQTFTFPFFFLSLNWLISFVFLEWSHIEALKRTNPMRHLEKHQNQQTQRPRSSNSWNHNKMFEIVERKCTSGFLWFLNVYTKTMI